MSSIFNFVASKLFSTEPQASQKIETENKVETKEQSDIKQEAQETQIPQNETLKVETVKTLKLNELKKELRTRNIKVGGKKSQLVQRLTSYLNGTLDESFLKTSSKSSSNKKTKKAAVKRSRKRTFIEMTEQKEESQQFLEKLDSIETQAKPQVEEFVFAEPSPKKRRLLTPQNPPIVVVNTTSHKASVPTSNLEIKPETQVATASKVEVVEELQDFDVDVVEEKAETFVLPDMIASLVDRIVDEAMQTPITPQNSYNQESVDFGNTCSESYEYYETRDSLDNIMEQDMYQTTYENMCDNETQSEIIYAF